VRNSCILFHMEIKFSSFTRLESDILGATLKITVPRGMGYIITYLLSGNHFSNWLHVTRK
jgi:hypothetical protein